MTTETAPKPPKSLHFTGGTQTEWAKARFEKLRSEDRQFSSTIPDPLVVEAKEQPGLRLAQVVQTIMEGYADRPAIGERVRELVTDAKNGRSSLRMLDRFETCSFGELWARVRRLR